MAGSLCTRFLASTHPPSRPRADVQPQPPLSDHGDRSPPCVCGVWRVADRSSSERTRLFFPRRSTRWLTSPSSWSCSSRRSLAVVCCLLQASLLRCSSRAACSSTLVRATCCAATWCCTPLRARSSASTPKASNSTSTPSRYPPSSPDKTTENIPPRIQREEAGSNSDRSQRTDSAAATSSASTPSGTCRLHDQQRATPARGAQERPRTPSWRLVNLQCNARRQMVATASRELTRLLSLLCVGAACGCVGNAGVSRVAPAQGARVRCEPTVRLPVPVRGAGRVASLAGAFVQSRRTTAGRRQLLLCGQTARSYRIDFGGL